MKTEMDLRDSIATLDPARRDAGAGEVEVARLKALRDARVRALLASRRPGGTARPEARESQR
jgi:hypothetical protein